MGNRLNFSAQRANGIWKHQISDALSLLWVPVDIVSGITNQWLDSYKVLNDWHAGVWGITLREAKAWVDIALVCTANEFKIDLSLAFVLLNDLLGVPIALDQPVFHFFEICQIRHLLEDFHDSFRLLLLLLPHLLLLLIKVAGDTLIVPVCILEHLVAHLEF